MERKIAVLDVQGFRGFNNKFIVKELAVCTDMKNFRHFLIKPPYDFGLLSEKEQRMANWLKRNHHGIEWSSGDYTLKTVKKYLDFHLKDFNIYMKDEQKRQWVSHFWKHNNLYALSELECNISLENLKKMYPIDNDVTCKHHQKFCDISIKNKTAVCALMNALCIKQFMEKNTFWFS